MLRSEYPRPQMRRNTFLNLNGAWDFAFDFTKCGKGKHWESGKVSFPEKIEVPFCPESRLSGLAHTDFIHACWYQREMEIPADWKGRILLHFEAAYYHTEVYVNGKAAGSHDGGYTPFCFDITDLLCDGKGTLTVYCEGDARDKSQPSGKQCDFLDSYGCFYTRSTGIWQTVWLECVPTVHLESIKVDPDVDNGTLHAQLSLAGTGKKTVTLTARLAGKEVGVTSASTTAQTLRMTLPLSEVSLWTVETPTLYDLTVTVFDESGVCDCVDSYFGMRKVEWDKNGLILNGKHVFMRMVLDQGYYPDGVYTAPSDADLEKDILLSKRLGFNGARLHERVFEQRFLYHCDRLGYIVWGEYPNWGFDHTNPAYIYRYQKEWMEAVTRDYNHPAIIGWCPMNENWFHGSEQEACELLRTLYRETKRYDPYRPVIDVSWNYHAVTDIYDTHDYEQDIPTFRSHYEKFTDGKIFDQWEKEQPLKYDRSMPYFLSEYGGFKWSEDQNGWGYGNAPKTLEEFQERYETFASILLNNPDICGLCYTQLYDVEQEQNGLYYYSRAPKFSEEMMDSFARVMSQKAAMED